jgi:hypothetical protein
VSSRTFGYYKYTTGLSFAEERIGPLAAIVTIIFYLLALYLLILPNTPENLFASIYSDSLIKTAHQHLLLLVGFDTLIYRKYYDTPPILVGHQRLAVGTRLLELTLFILAVLRKMEPEASNNSTSLSTKNKLEVTPKLKNLEISGPIFVVSVTKNCGPWDLSRSAHL